MTPPLVVLIADRDRDSAFALFRLLRIAGHDPHVAASTEEARQVALSCRPDAALVGLGEDGPALADWLGRSASPPRAVACLREGALGRLGFAEVSAFLGD
jgi:hypothetical protein